MNIIFVLAASALLQLKKRIALLRRLHNFLLFLPYDSNYFMLLKLLYVSLFEYVNFISNTAKGKGFKHGGAS